MLATHDPGRTVDHAVARARHQFRSLLQFSKMRAFQVPCHGYPPSVGVHGRFSIGAHEEPWCHRGARLARRICALRRGLARIGDLPRSSRPSTCGCHGVKPWQ